MKIHLLFFVIVSLVQSPCISSGLADSVAGTIQAFPPAAPLVVHDPYFSIWSPSDRLAESWPQHWTGTIHGLCGLVRIDGKVFRIMGMDPRQYPTMQQVGMKVLPTRTFYDFEAGGVHVTLTFLTPLLPHDLELVSRPVTYLAWQVRTADHHDHDVIIYHDITAEPVVNDSTQQVVWSRPDVKSLKVMRFGSLAQPVLKEAGDDRRIDWGYLYVAAGAGKEIEQVFGGHQTVRLAFCNTGMLPRRDDTRMPRAARDDYPIAATTFNLGNVGTEGKSCFLMLAYDEEYCIEYLGTKLRPYWRRNGMNAAELLVKAADDYVRLAGACEAFDKELMIDLTRVGGKGYAQLCALCYRQAIGAHILAAAPDGRPMLFSKECFSNGCISTVDVIYPTSPIFALLNNELLKASVTPVFDYAASGHWTFPFAPHDLGVYPKANGQVYGGGERSEKDQMPVEESANMLILAATISQLDHNTNYVQKYWPQLSRWAAYLKQEGLDPSNQLCTDDFAGHMAHNTNLSLKAIVAMGAYARMCEMAGKKDESSEYRRLAEGYVVRWTKMAEDGDHYRLAFDRSGTWSQKYNLVWDRLLHLNLFPSSVAAREIAFYKTKLNTFGLPLDNRAEYTKTDWEVWTATLATSRGDFELLMNPVYDFARCTPQRVPLTDWYQTRTARQQGFQARSVVGGVFIKMLSDDEVWRRWSAPGRSAGH